MELIDCDKLLVDPRRTFGGLTGAKICVQYDGRWYMLKRCQRLQGLQYKNVELSYANDPIMEYIGSHIYQLLGIPAHHTLLGIYQGRLCVLCSDLGSITEFRCLRSTLMDEDIIQHNSGVSTKLNDIMEIISKSDRINKEEYLRRFWTMFAVDSLIGNTDRNNGNWGFYWSESLGRFTVCPVYDCGGCLIINVQSNRCRWILTVDVLPLCL